MPYVIPSGHIKQNLPSDPKIGYTYTMDTIKPNKNQKVRKEGFFTYYARARALLN